MKKQPAEARLLRRGFMWAKGQIVTQRAWLWRTQEIEIDPGARDGPASVQFGYRRLCPAGHKGLLQPIALLQSTGSKLKASNVDEHELAMLHRQRLGIGQAGRRPSAKAPDNVTPCKKQIKRITHGLDLVRCTKPVLQRVLDLTFNKITF